MHVLGLTPALLIQEFWGWAQPSAISQPHPQGRVGVLVHRDVREPLVSWFE